MVDTLLVGSLSCLNLYPESLNVSVPPNTRERERRRERGTKRDEGVEGLYILVDLIHTPVLFRVVSNT